MLWNSLKPKLHFHLHPCTLQSRCADVRRAGEHQWKIARLCTCCALRRFGFGFGPGPAPTFSGSAFRSNSRPGSRSFCRGTKPPPASQSQAVSSLAPSQAGAEGAPKRHNEACPPRPRHDCRVPWSWISLHVPAAEYSGPGFMMCLSARTLHVLGPPRVVQVQTDAKCPMARWAGPTASAVFGGLDLADTRQDLRRLLSLSWSVGAWGPCTQRCVPPCTASEPQPGALEDWSTDPSLPELEVIGAPGPQGSSHMNTGA